MSIKEKLDCIVYSKIIVCFDVTGIEVTLPDGVKKKIQGYGYFLVTLIFQPELVSLSRSHMLVTIAVAFVMNMAKLSRLMEEAML